MHNIQSPRTDDAGIEGIIKALGADKAPRVTPADIEANITSEHYFTAEDGVQGALAKTQPELGTENPALALRTFCVLVLRNGFTVTGESAFASPENFNAEIARRIARENAVAKIWPLMGYALKEKLHAATPADDNDFPLGQACDLSGDGTCEACQ